LNLIPLHADELIHLHFGAVVFLVQFPPQPAEVLVGQRLTGFGAGIDLPLKFRKHGLAVHRAPDGLQVLVDDKQALLLVLGNFQQVGVEQGLVEGRGHFGQEDGIAGTGGRLELVAVIGVHGMPQLMGYGKDRVQGVVVIEKDEGLGAVTARRVSAAALALVLKDVHPPLPESLACVADIIFPQGRQGSENQVPGLFKGHLYFDLRHQGSVDVVHGNFVQAQHPLL